MPLDRFLIAPLNTGLQTDLKPWQIMDDAFEQLQNAYIFRGRLRKRFGSLWMGNTQQKTRLRISLAAGGAGIGITDAGGNAVGNVRAISGDATLPLAVGQQFSVGTAVYTVISSVAGAQPMLATQGNGTFDISNGNFVINGAPVLTTVFFYPGLPVMGLTQYESGAINNHPSYAFDTRWAYRFTPGVGWDRSGAGANPVWHGTDLNYFWAYNWDGITPNIVTMFVTNSNATIGVPGANDDPIWVTQDGATWTNFSPLTIFLTAGNFVRTARIIVPFKNRLVLLNTIESNPAGNLNTAFPNRCRYSHNGSPFATNAWLEPNQTTGGTFADGAGFIDATTEEAIISAEFIKDRLIVYFERSTWELAYTGNEVLPFVWQKINTELGSQATFSSVPFDKQILTIGNTGVHACNGANVERIDSKIPDEIFEFKVSNNEQLRIAGIRDYIFEMVYWAFVADTDTATQKFPNQLLVYNYRNGSWAINDDCFTTFGYYEQQGDTTWSSTNLTWAQATFTWTAGIIQANQRQILGGTPEGWVLIIDGDVARNAPSMQITNMTIPSVLMGAGFVDLQVINHNCALNDYVAVENTNGIALPITGIYEVVAIIDANNITIRAADIAGVYTGGGTLARVSNIQILSKRWNPYVNQGRNLHLARIDFAVDKTQNGQITVDYYPSSTEVSMLQGGVASGAIMGNNVLETSPYPANLYPLEQFQDLLWHPIYFQSVGEFIQLVFYFTNAQITNPLIAFSDFEIEGLVLHTQRASARLQ